MKTKLVLTTMRHTLLILLIIGMAAGCSSGVTDVGNPKNPADVPASGITSFPAVANLVGVYALQTSDSPTPCSIDSGKTPQIAAGVGATQVVLQHFLAFTTASDSITTDYDVSSGLFGTLDTQDDSVCIGSAKFVSSDVQVTIDCQAGSIGGSACASVFLKVSQ